MKPKKPWTEMTTAELRRATKDLNGSVLGKIRPLSMAERACGKNPAGIGPSVRERPQKLSA